MNISLIGMMGSGKSTIGKILQQKLEEYTFIDTDEEIIKSENLSINEIFEQKGEDYFREIESKTLNLILEKKNQIISTGGGIIKRDKNIQNLKQNSLVIFLSADTNTLYERLKNNKDRPLLNSEDMKNKIETLLKERIDKYKKAHIEINTTNKPTELITEEIIRELKNNEKNRC